MKYFKINIVLNGKKHTNHIQAQNKLEAIELIQNSTGGTLLKIAEVPMPIEVKFAELKTIILEKFGKKKINIQEFAVFLRQLGVMTNAGISLIDAIHEGISSTNDKQIKEIFIRVMEDIEAGLNMTDSLKDYEYEVGSVTIAMIKMGEMTGRLSESFQKLADILESIKANKDNMKKALRMPMISMLVLAGAFVFLIMLVVPKFKGIFSKLGADLPMPTQLLLGIESVLSSYGVFILLGIIGLIIAHKQTYIKNKEYQFKVDKYMLKIYLIGKITKISMLERFTMIMSELLEAGIPLTSSLETASHTIENLYLREQFLSVNTAIQRGFSLAEGLEETELFEKMVIQMVKSGESSGQIDVMLQKITEYYKTKFQHIIDNIATYIEPMLMIVVAGMVLLLALGIFLPMWDLAGAAK